MAGVPEASISLNGAWRFRAEPDGAAAETFLREADDPRAHAWSDVTLPAPWQRWAGPEFHGVGWFAREIDVPDHAPRLRLRFDAVATEARLWVNGREAGACRGDYVPHEIDLTDLLTPGEKATLLVRVDEKPDFITKGFHDVVSVHHGGIWQDAWLIPSGETVARPDGVAVHADLEAQQVDVLVELARVGEDASVEVEITDEEDRTIARGDAPVAPGAREAVLSLTTGALERWSPESPTLYHARLTLRDAGGESEVHRVRLGARSVEATARHVLLNGRPIHLRGVLHWGHEPEFIAPAPPPERVRAEFKALRERGFNCVCLCMWYPPRHFHEIADETGLLLWQEHPVWQSSMDPEHLDEYRRQYAAFLRRDRNHPSVIVVDATCEHPNFDPDLAAWWWDEAKRLQPNVLHQVQTASFAWSDPERTDLHDEHTYENNNRWPFYLEDVQAVLADLPPKPFVMGESVLFTSWLPVPDLRSRLGGERPWWLPARFEDAARWEDAWRERHGDATLARFRAQGDRHHLLGRKFQVETFRRYPNHAGLVMNHLRDVPPCTCGFVDDLDRWRFTPRQTRGWLGDVVLFLETSCDRRAFLSGERAAVELGVSNFGPTPIDAPIRHALARTDESHDEGHAAVLAACGEVARAEIELRLPEVDRPTRVRLRASIDDARNEWDLWTMPEVGESVGEGVYRLEGLPFTAAEREPDAVEAAYSRGFGIEAKSWQPALPEIDRLGPELPAWHAHEPLPPDARVVVTHRLTRDLVDFLARGGRVFLLASKAAGALRARYEWLFGQVPLVIEEGPLDAGDSEWIVDLLGFDLTRRGGRVIPVDDLEIRDDVDPLVRLCYTHDAEAVRFFDLLFATRVGQGVLVASALDHRGPAGRYLLAETLAWLADDPAPLARLDPSRLVPLTAEADEAAVPAEAQPPA